MIHLTEEQQAVAACDLQPGQTLKIMAFAQAPAAFYRRQPSLSGKAHHAESNFGQGLAPSKVKAFSFSWGRAILLYGSLMGMTTVNPFSFSVTTGGWAGRDRPLSR